MTEDKKIENVVTVRGLLVEFLGAIGEISSKADKIGEVAKLEDKLSELKDDRDMRSRWWSEECKKTAKLESEIKELKFKLAGSTDE